MAVTAAHPDVTVVVAVYNTMPYLRECLASLVGQTIGVDRLEVIAVDDGSTDESGAELDSWAERYPDTIKVLHQANSGGPAMPSNRALELATGRYVFFIGADDHLGAEALKRLVTTADRLDADIVLGRMVGAGGRYVNQAVYKPGNRDSITLADSDLCWALSNTKLFRRSLLEENGIRYPEQMSSYSDQPFTLRAVVAARRIAVRADYEFYYAVRRDDQSNITYRTSVLRFLQDAEVVMDTVADVVTDPVSRARVLRRNFTWEVYKLVSDRYVAAGPEERRQVQEGVRKLSDTYLTEEIRASLDVHRRVPISIAQHGTLEDLNTVAEYAKEYGLGPLLVEGEHIYTALPGFRNPDADYPDAWFEVPVEAASAKAQRWPATVTWRTGNAQTAALHVEWSSRLSALGDGASAWVGNVEAKRLEAVPRQDGGLTIRAEFALADLATGLGWKAKRLKFRHSAADDAIVHDVTAAKPAVLSVRYRRGLRFYKIAVRINEKSRLSVVINPFQPRKLAGRLVRKLRP
ncbi:glycosyltransferase [Actinoplanes sp. NPDC024001]|uniref:glycosyltransferase family 2 protein n=1 Tax=Actinoplanes sp. NPDC024001 TaxID=3154598 RepID=UPI0033D66754